MEPSKYSLKLRETLYKDNLYKSSFNHGCYFNVFNSCRKQEDLNNSETCIPLLSSFSSSNVYDKILLTQSFPKSKAFFVNSFEDKCMNMVRDKKNYNKYFQHCRRKYKMQYKHINENIKRVKGDIVLPVYLINLCNTNDPDPYFDTFYDWYYTGGVLNTVNIENQEYFVGVLEDDLCIRYLNNAKINQIFHLNDGHIFNIGSYSYNHCNYVTLRGKNNLRLIHFSYNNEELTLHEDWHNMDEISYADFKLYSKDTVGSINILNVFKSIDVEAQNTIIEHKIVESTGKPNKYCLFDSTDKQNLLFMDRKTIKSFDMRSSEENVVLTMDTFPLNRCEELCCFKISKSNPNCIFACTNHTIAKIDLRNKNIVKQWSHLLTSPPILIDSLESDNEYICISSFKDRVLLYSTPEENYLPILVPNPIDTFSEVNLEAPIILEGLNKRLQSSINGLKLSLDNKNNIAIHYSNSFGDIFCNNIQMQSYNKISQNGVDNTIPHEKMKKWLKGLQRKCFKHPKPVYATEIATEWSCIKQLHCKNIIEENLAKYQDDTIVQMQMDMNPFDFDMSAIWGNRSDEIQLPEEPSSVRKVTEWLSHVE